MEIFCSAAEPEAMTTAVKLFIKKNKIKHISGL
jgi:hypothetical protein